MKRVVCSLIFLSILTFFPSRRVEAQTADRTGSALLMPVEEVKAGMKGVARTVFAGAEAEEFGVEVLGVIPGFPNPKQSAIIARLSGAKVERTGVFAGMSGSPVYIDGKLVGAIAFSFPFSKEPIAGITPIKYMIDIFEKGKEGAAPQQPQKVSFTELSSTIWKSPLPRQSISAAPLIAPVSDSSPLVGLLGQQIAPIATPVVFSGIRQDALSVFAPQLVAGGLLPVSGVGGSAAIAPLTSATDKTLSPGSSVSVQLVRGDYSIAAAGTVTFRDGNRIYAFGHPFLSLGAADMPMTEASVVTVIPNTNNSFKLSVPGNMVGSISQDRSTGVFGTLGHSPKMIPVKINLHTSRDRAESFNYEIVNDKFLAPLLLNITIYNTITSSERSMGDATISISGKIGINGHLPIELERRFSAGNAAQMASGSVAVPVGALLSSGFENVEISGVTLDIASVDDKKTATLERIAVDKTELRRGETVEVQAFVRTEAGKQFVQRIPVQIPTDVPPGQLLLFVGDGSALQQGSAAQAFVPQDLSQLVDAINKTKKGDRLYVKLFRITTGAVIGTSELPNLPPSVIATLNSERSSGGFTPTVLSPVLEKELAPAEFVISGQQLIGIDVSR
jgi:hypothetical protein